MTIVKRIATLLAALTCLTHAVTVSAQTAFTGSATTTTTCVQNADLTITCTTPASSVTLTSGIVIPPAPTAPAGCRAFTSFGSVAVGATVLPQLSVSCTTLGTGLLTYAWSRVPSTGTIATTSTYALTAAADAATVGTFTYSVVVSNFVGSAPSAEVSIIVTPTVPVTSVGVNYCPGGQAANTSFDASAPYVRLNSTNLVGPNTYYIVKMNVPASGAGTAGRYPALLSHIEAPGEVPNGRTVSLSRNLCDFSDATTFLGLPATEGAKELTVQEPSRGYRNLEPGTWYISVKPSFCTTGKRCNVAIEWVNY